MAVTRKASGVYVNIIDKSQSLDNEAQFNVIFAGFSQRGFIGINDVSYAKMALQVGNNPQYDPRVNGFNEYLALANTGKFFRLNQQAGTWQTTIADMTGETDLMKIQFKSPGSWGYSAIYAEVSPVVSSKYVTMVAQQGQITLPEAITDQSVCVKDPNGLLVAVESTQGTLTYVNNSSVTGTVSRVTETSPVVTLQYSDSSKDYTKLQVCYIPKANQTYDVSVYNNSSSPIILETIRVSTDPSSAFYYLDNVGDYIQVSLLAREIPILQFFADQPYVNLINFVLDDGGDIAGQVPSDGYTDADGEFSVAAVDFTVLDHDKSPIVCLNGLQGVELIQAFITACAVRGKTCLWDAATFDRYTNTYLWSLSFDRSEYDQLYSVPSVTRKNGNEIKCYASVYAAKAYARQYNATGRYSLPPAGTTYGMVDANYILNTDFEDHKDELVRNNINWIRAINQGYAVWEQRTGYELSPDYSDSDLCYASTVSIVRQIKERLVNFSNPFMFNVQSPETWTSLLGGIKSILNNAVSDAELTKYTVKAPTWAQLEEAHSRSVKISIDLYVAQDYEVITYDLIISR